MLPLCFTQSKKFSELIYEGENHEFLGNTPSLGKRINLFLLKIDIYICETEPKLEPCKGLRIVSWHVPKNKDVFEKIKMPGWFGPLGKYVNIAKPIPIIDVQEIEYYKRWTQKKRQRRSLWLKKIGNKELIIETCDLPTYIKHYLESSLPQNVKTFNELQLNKLYKIYRSEMHLYLINDRVNKKTIAGMCILHDYELDQLIYHSCFLDKEYKILGVGMLDTCINLAKKNGLRFVNLVAMNSKGNVSKSWKGFTAFKLEFNPIIIYFRQSYFKITFNL